ncbi:bifunctional 3'-5' exonuclease/DNA polymerase [Actinocorallia sp. B10E7]|uniref:bifunctional 3'-5' exonuclease/DNA polymerase n=1 Tax=Actinocorallia sp. B10E7 TaxID=3153558 RepID=UPI00325EF3BE
MFYAVAPSGEKGGALRALTRDGSPAGDVEHVDDLAAAVAERERRSAPRWVWASTARLYPRLLRAGVRVGRCHDLELTEALLLAFDGRTGESRSVTAALARLRGLPPPEEEPQEAEGEQQLLFGARVAPPVETVVEVYAAQAARLEGRLRLLAAAESAGGLIAAEMSHEGLPWRADVHDELLTGLLGPRPAHGLRPRLLQELADRICAEFGHPVNPDSPQQLVKAFAGAGFPVSSTRAHVLKGVPHPAVPAVLEYKELSRLHTAHGWSWLDAWAKGGRFRPEYVVGGVVSGRWATRGGGALQIPKVLRRAVVADPGHVLVVADAAQLEPRVLAALAGDAAFAEAAAQGDLYAALAAVFSDTPGGPSARDKAKIAMLSAMYGGGTGEAVQLLSALKQRFPDAFGYVESAARAGERGELVRSLLGRTCPPASPEYRDLITTEAGRAAAASRGRFTRNFVVQATAAEWALAFMALLRPRLPAGAHLVFFQHDEVIIHTPEASAGAVTGALHAAAAEAARLLFGDTPVVFPMEIAAVPCYGDAK